MLPMWHFEEQLRRAQLEHLRETRGMQEQLQTLCRQMEHMQRQLQQCGGVVTSLQAEVAALRVRIRAPQGARHRSCPTPAATPNAPPHLRAVGAPPCAEQHKGRRPCTCEG